MMAIDYLLLVVRNRWIIIKNVLITAVLSSLLSFLLPTWFKSTAEIIPINSDTGGISSLLAGYSLDIVGKNAITPESFRIILNSQAIKDSLIQKFDLRTRYGQKYKERLYKEIEENVKVEVEKESGFGFEPIIGMYISVSDKEPETSARMANYCLAFLDSTIKALNRLYLQKKYTYIDDRYQKNIRDLNKVQNEIRGFSTIHGIFDIEEQIKASIDILGELEAKREELKIELFLMRNQFEANNPKYRRISLEIESINNKILEYNTGITQKSDQPSIVPPLDNVPELRQQFTNLYRDNVIQNKIFEMLKIEYEQAKMQLSKDIPAFLILSEASIPTYKDRPKRILIVLSLTILIFFITLFYIILKQYLKDQEKNDVENYSKFIEIIDLLKSDFKRKK
jgi:tyrosine-protein kinase Etk/Wzc